MVNIRNIPDDGLLLTETCPTNYTNKWKDHTTIWTLNKNCENGTEIILINEHNRKLKYNIETDKSVL
jgi:hypothetical protein